ncbi:MAG: hypothetical protein ACYC5N_06980, partial [Endomicrobiales bacterium]
RYGTDMIVYTEMDETEIQRELTDYLCGREEKWRRLDTGKLRFLIRKELFPEIDAINSLDEAKKLRDMLLKPAEHTSFVEIYYEIAVPGIFTVWNHYVPGDLPEKLTVSARSEILAGTGVYE